MLRNIFIVLVVLLRTIALYLVARGLISWGAALVATAGNPSLPWYLLMIPTAQGILLWVLSKPIAVLITRDLD